ncbi:MAG: sorbosone dehydrogenase family protein [Bryobacteraceae bacterium]|nr:sorbosone dehydrogenase family protein [Bryobacteraceae bacterium]
MSRIRRTAAAAAILAGSFLLPGQQQPVPLPKPYHTPSARNAPQIISRPDGAQLQVPAGFTVDEYAADFQKPRYMALGPNNEVLISDSVPNGSVYVLIDKDGDYKAEERKRLLEGLDRPYGLAFWKDYLYVAETTSLKRYKYDAKTMSVGPGEEVVSMKDFGQGHWTRTVLFDRKGKKMYLAIGSKADVVTGDHPMRAAINRFNPDGTGHEIFASGLRNPVGLAWYPGTDTLWAAVQERDSLGDDLAPDYFTRVQPNGFYGWPYAYIGPNEEPRVKAERPDLVKKTIVPDVLLQSHVAVLDARFYTGTQFPAEYRNGAFLALHGSSNRSKRVGYSVVFVPFKNGKPSGPVQDFLTGWMLSPEKREVWGRPVGLLQLQDGSLLVSEDGGNKIWRVSYKKK